MPNPLCRACTNGTIIPAQEPGGYLASITVEEENHCGSSSCPWVLQARIGQQLNITLIDFASAHREPSSANSHFGSTEICYKYATIKEKVKNKEKDIEKPLCGGLERERHVYLSETNSVKIEVAGGRRGGNFGYFMLQYEGLYPLIKHLT